MPVSLFRGALFVRPTNVVWVFAICCASRGRKCFASRGIVCSSNECSCGVCFGAFCGAVSVLLRGALFVRPKDVVGFLLCGAFCGAASVLICGALFVRPKDVVWVFDIWCVSQSRKCFASRGIVRSSERCSFGFCYFVRFAEP